MEAGAQMMGESLFVRREYRSHTCFVVYVSACPDKHTQGGLVQHFPKPHLLAPPQFEAHATSAVWLLRAETTDTRC